MKKTVLAGQTVFITGASSGIGKAAAKQFAELGANLILTARREERLHTLAKELESDHKVNCYPYQLDVRNYKQIESLLQQIDNIEVDVLLNNAGLALGTDKLQDGQISNWDTVIDTNVKGLLYVTRLILPKMIKRNRGHIINISSIAGYECYPGGNVYCATKHAVRAISRSLRLDLIGTKIRVTDVAPGAVETEFSEVRYKNKERAKKIYEGFEPLTPEDIADAIIYCASRPEHVNIAEILIMPQAQASIRDIYRT